MNLDKKINLLDCTLRDGGYYNNWKFTPTEINNYISSIGASNIKYLEIGFHFLEKNSEYGKCAYVNFQLL